MREGQRFHHPDQEVRAKIDAIGAEAPQHIVEHELEGHIVSAGPCEIDGHLPHRTWIMFDHVNEGGELFID